MTDRENTLRLFLLPPGGGSAALYNAWQVLERIPQVTVEAVELPGRGRRIFERLPSGFEGYLDQVRSLPGGEPWAVFGHSFGGLLAAEWAVEAQAAGNGPRLVIASGTPAPWVFNPATRLADTPGSTWDKVVNLGGVPEALQRDPAARRILGRALEADLGVAARLGRDAPMELGCPVVALHGRDDPLIPAGSAEAWSQASPAFSHRVLPGGHFFIQGLDDALPIVADVLTDLMSHDKQGEFAC